MEALMRASSVETYPAERHHHTANPPTTAIKAARPASVFQERKFIANIAALKTGEGPAV
jgi:hypothetical protein